MRGAQCRFKDMRVKKVHDSVEGRDIKFLDGSKQNLFFIAAVRSASISSFMELQQYSGKGWVSSSHVSKKASVIFTVDCCVFRFQHIVDPYRDGNYSFEDLPGAASHTCMHWRNCGANSLNALAEFSEGETASLSARVTFVKKIDGFSR